MNAGIFEKNTFSENTFLLTTKIFNRTQIIEYNL